MAQSEESFYICPAPPSHLSIQTHFGTKKTLLWLCNLQTINVLLHPKFHGAAVRQYPGNILECLANVIPIQQIHVLGKSYCFMLHCYDSAAAPVISPSPAIISSYFQGCMVLPRPTQRQSSVLYPEGGLSVTMRLHNR